MEPVSPFTAAVSLLLFEEKLKRSWSPLTVPQTLASIPEARQRIPEGDHPHPSPAPNPLLPPNLHQRAPAVASHRHLQQQRALSLPRWSTAAVSQVLLQQELKWSWSPLPGPQTLPSIPDAGRALGEQGREKSVPDTSGLERHFLQTSSKIYGSPFLQLLPIWGLSLL